MRKQTDWHARGSGIARRPQPVLRQIMLRAAGTVLLSLLATTFFYVVAPKGERLTPPGSAAPAAAVPPAPSLEPAAAAEPAPSPPRPAPRPVRPASPSTVAAAGQTEAPAEVEVMTVIQPGQVALTAAQEAALQGAGSGWGSTTAAARAVIDAIPAEAYTTDW